jgi:hypothetical protein
MSENKEFKDPTVTISGVPYPVKFGFLSLSIFNDAGLQMSDCTKASVLLRLYHSAIVAGCKRNNVPEISWDEFLLCLDDDDNKEVFFDLKKLYEADNAPKK